MVSALNHHSRARFIAALQTLNARASSNLRAPDVLIFTFSTVPLLVSQYFINVKNFGIWLKGVFELLK